MSADWPVCRHRGVKLDGERFRCEHPRLHAPQGATRETCEHCATGGVYCDAKVSRERKRPESSSAREDIARLRSRLFTEARNRPCDFLGPIVEQRNARGEPCRCPGRWLRRCELHGVCTLTDAERRNVPRCLACPDYVVE